LFFVATCFVEARAGRKIVDDYLNTGVVVRLDGGPPGGGKGADGQGAKEEYAEESGPSMRRKW
jgi:hypothetical protein